MRTTALPRFAAFIAAAALLTGCALLPDRPSPIDPTGSPLPLPPGSTGQENEVPLLDADVLLLVSATATADDGSAMNLSLRVHSSTPWDSDDPAAAIRPEFVSSACSGYLNAGVYAAQNWSFALIDYSATLADGTDAWAASAKLGVRPTSQFLSIAGGGILIDDPTAAIETPHCKRDKLIAGSGDGTIVTGFIGDDALTKWAGHVYGFQALAGATIAGCTVVLTGPGELAGGVAEAWNTIDTASECSVGPAVEMQDS